jgi:hypothetical protein
MKRLDEFCGHKLYLMAHLDTIDPVLRWLVLTAGASAQILRVGLVQFRLLIF